MICRLSHSFCIPTIKESDVEGRRGGAQLITWSKWWALISGMAFIRALQGRLFRESNTIRKNLPVVSLSLATICDT